MVFSFFLIAATFAQTPPEPAQTRRSNPVGTARIAFDQAGETQISLSGFADLSTQRPLTADDPIRIASISKLVVAIGAMRLVEQGKLDLDADVSRYLGWTLRNPHFPKTAITLRMILSHQSGLTDKMDYVSPLDAESRSALANPGAWDDAHVPGSWFAYANLNTQVVAMAMERVTGERFDTLMARLVLKPLKIDACYQYISCSDATIARGVTIYRDGKPTKDATLATNPECPVTPASNGSCDFSAYWRAGKNGAIFSPQGGLRISARNLARIGRLLLNHGTLDGVRILSPRSVKLLETPLWRYNGTNGDSEDGLHCAYGLSTMFVSTGGEGCRDDVAGDGISRFGHYGTAYGMKSGLWIDRKAGTGTAYFINDVPPEPGAHSAFSAAEEKLAGTAP